MLQKLRERLKGVFKREQVEEKSSTGLSGAALASEGKRLLAQLYEELGARPSATKESRRSARRIAAIFEQYTSDVTLTSCRVYNNVSRGLIAIGSVVMIAMVVLLFFNLSLLSLIIGTLFILCVILELKGHKTVLRLFFSSSDSCNVHAVLNPTEKVKETVIFSSHHDTARDEGDTKKLSVKLFLKYGVPILAFLLLYITAVVSLAIKIKNLRLGFRIAPWPLIIVSALGLALALSSLLVLRIKEKGYSKGAGDNLAGVVAVTELLRYFSEKKGRGEGLKHIRLIFVSFDAEEAACQGSRSWYSQNVNLFKNAKNINIDGIYRADDLALMTNDGNGLISLSAKLAAECSDIASSMGYRVDIGRFGILGGESDASSAARAGLEATTISSMRPDVKCPAHSANDTPESVEEYALQIVIDVGRRFAEEEDNRFLNSEANNNDSSLLSSSKKYKLVKG